MAGGFVVFIALVLFIVAHEAGHYFAAKATGMKVTEFFLGFGPRIWSFKRGETEYGIKPIDTPDAGAYDAMIVTVGHYQFADLGVDRIRAFGKNDAVLYDVKYLFPASATDGRL